MRKQNPLPIAADGYRDGHPRVGATELSSRAAADLLNTSTTTIRRLITEDLLDGYWRRQGKIYCYKVYAEAAETFLAQYGPFPGAAKRLRSASTTATSRPRPEPVHSPSGAAVLRLQHTVLRQQRALDLMQEAFRSQEQARKAERKANRKTEQASKMLRRAIAELTEIGAVDGIPDFVPSEIQD